MITKESLPQDIRDLPANSFDMVADQYIKDEAFQTKPIGFFKDAFIRLTKNKVSVFSFWVIIVVILLAIFAPGFNDFTYLEQDITLKDMPPRIPFLEDFGIADGTRVLENRKVSSLEDEDRYPPEAIIEIIPIGEVKGVQVVDVVVDYYAYSDAEDVYFWFGSDALGRDLFTRLFRGARISLIIAFASVLTNLVIGVIYGAVAGYYGGKVDMIMMRITEILSGIPYLVMTMMFILVLGTGLFAIILALTITGWIPTARLIRAQFYRFKGREYVLAARTLGVPDKKLIFRHILPNSVGPLITRSMIAIPGAIFSESFLAYIGLGVPSPEPSIGVMLAEGQKVLLQYPYQTLFPAILISVLMIAFNLFSNGLRDALDPTRRGEE